MTDEIRNEIQKKNKLYAKAKKNKDAKEWDEFKDLRNKVTRMIRDAKNDYLAKNPEQVCTFPIIFMAFFLKSQRLRGFVCPSNTLKGLHF